MLKIAKKMLLGTAMAASLFAAPMAVAEDALMFDADAATMFEEPITPQPPYCFQPICPPLCTVVPIYCPTVWCPPIMGPCVPCIDYECLPETAEYPWWWGKRPGAPVDPADPFGPIDPKARDFGHMTEMLPAS